MIPVHRWVEVTALRQAALNTFILSCHEPESASQIQPGQFCMISPEPHTSDVFLPRPFSYFSVDKDGNLEILFRTVGRATGWMAGLSAGDRIGVFGPLGNTFSVVSKASRVILVAGGVGLPPMVLLANCLAALENPPEIDLIYGERAGDSIVNIGSYLPGNTRLHLCSEDGAVGEKGIVTEPFSSLMHDCVSPPAVYTCGPNVMMGAVARMISPERVALFEASTEENMACGKGICKGCVVPMDVKEGPAVYRYCCTDGPVFNGFEVKWPQN